MKLLKNKYTKFIYNKIFGLSSNKNNRIYSFQFSENPTSKASGYEFFTNIDNPLTMLGDKHKPTKQNHNYLIYYWNHFRDIRYDVGRVLEIGVQTGNSLQMWEEFFPNAVIYGIDIDEECKELESGRKKVYIGDQTDTEFLKEVVSDAGGSFDIIIDDGSHIPSHQLSTFNFLFPYLSQHGIYVIEDTGGCTGDFQLYVVNSLKQLIDSIMYWPHGVSTEQWPYVKDLGSSAKWIDKNIVGIDFYRWIVFIMKGDNPNDNKYLRDRN